MAVPLRRGVKEGKCRAIKEKIPFLTFLFDGKIPTAIKLEGGGGLRP